MIIRSTSRVFEVGLPKIDLGQVLSPVSRVREEDISKTAFRTRYGHLGIQASSDTVIDNKGIHVDPAKIESVNVWASLSHHRRSVSFLGLVGYYRRFIGKAFKDCQTNDDSSLKEGQVEWGDNHDADVPVIEAEFVLVPPILAFTRGSDIYRICDCFEEGLGVVLMAKGKKYEHEQRDGLELLSELRLRYSLSPGKAMSYDGCYKAGKNGETTFRVRVLVMTISLDLPNANLDMLRLKHGMETRIFQDVRMLEFVEEPIEITDREVKRLKQSRIPLVKVRWNSKRGPEFTWEREDQFRKKYPHLFTKTAPSSVPCVSLVDKAH
ncbi:hypothetical protein Tco_0169876 [Tanacetum coccineum]